LELGITLAYIEHDFSERNNSQVHESESW